MIKSLTSLRGIFILFIFFHHCMNLYPGGGSMAVAFFFVLGGVSMTLGYKERVLNGGFNYKQYIGRRLVKFYPLHWICLLVSLPLVFHSLSIGFCGLFGINAVLLQTWIPIRSVYFSFNSVSWYLANTMFFAMVFPFLLKGIVKASDFGKAIIALSFILFYVLVAILIPNDMHHAVLYISPYMRLTDFVFGIYLAMLYFKLKEKPIKWWNRNIVSQVLVIALIVLLVVESCLLTENVQMIAPVYWIPVASVILIASLSNSNGGGYNLLENRYLQYLGKLSFTIFLTHDLVIRYLSLFFKIFKKEIQFDNTLVFVLVALVLTIVISILIDKYILTPITQWLTKKIQPSMTARS